ncbi:MAG: entericidin A/B family lipoprotein [Gammaproteobacteria bacterium]|nr:entericidin A/B family lipoprotein [Gammaproteobacteria bacterium]
MKFENLIRTLGLAGALSLVMGLAACNTVEGVGEDVEAAGDAIEDEASERD